MGLEKGKKAGIEEGQERVLRRIAKKRCKLYKTLKAVGIGILSLASLTVSILLCCDVIKIPELQVNATATLIVSILFPLGVTGIFALVGSLLKIDEEKIYKSLFEKNARE